MHSVGCQNTQHILPRTWHSSRYTAHKSGIAHLCVSTLSHFVFPTTISCIHTLLPLAFVLTKISVTSNAARDLVHGPNSIGCFPGCNLKLTAVRLSNMNSLSLICEQKVSYPAVMTLTAGPVRQASVIGAGVGLETPLHHPLRCHFCDIAVSVESAKISV